MGDPINAGLLIAVLCFIWLVMLRPGWYREILKKGQMAQETFKVKSTEKSDQYQTGTAKIEEAVEKQKRIFQGWENERAEMKLKIDAALKEQEALKEKLALSESVLQEKAVSMP